MGERLDFSNWDTDRAARYALYETHRFCIRLPTEASLVDEDGEPRDTLDTETLALFLHEYTHFVHNVSTVAGWTAYELYLDVLALFTHSLDDGAECDVTRLSAEQQATIAESIRALLALEGGRALPPHPSKAVSLEVLEILERQEDFSGIMVPLCDVRWRILRRDSSQNDEILPLGAFLIEEGVAYLLETSVRQGRLSFEDGWTPDSGVPLFPYVAFQILCRHMAPGITPLSAARIGLVALNFNRPGHALIRTLRAYESLRRAGGDDEAVCQRFLEQVVPTISAILNRIQQHNLAALPALFVDRGILQRGIAQVARWFEEGLAARLRDIWFDLDWCRDSEVDRNVLSARFRTTTPCDIIQERPGAPTEVRRDLLLTFAPDDLNGVRALQAQLDFLLGHLATTGLVSTIEGGGRGCPFRTSCTLQLRVDEADACCKKPWTLWNRDRVCWYGAAVAGSLGTVAVLSEEASSGAG